MIQKLRTMLAAVEASRSTRPVARRKGLRTGDTHTLETLRDSGGNLSLRVTNDSGLVLLHWACGEGRRAPFAVS